MEMENKKTNKSKVTEPHLGRDLQRSLSGIFGTDSELGRLVD